MTDFVSGALAFFEASKYFLLFFGTLTEGPLVMMGGGLLFRFGQVAFWPAYLAMVAGDFIADIAWYGVGYFGARPAILRWGKHINITPAMVDKVEGLFKRHSDWILIISKLTMGFGFALTTLTVAGMLRVSFWRYALINLIGGFVWTLVLFYVGYFFGNVYDMVPLELRIAVAISGPVATFFLLRAGARYLSRSDWL